VNVVYSNVASPTIELRNPNGFEVCFIFSVRNVYFKSFLIKVCCSGLQVCNTTDSAWLPAPASRAEAIGLGVSLAVPSQCVSKPINGVRYLWKETPCLFKEAAVYNSEDSDLPAPPFIHYL
jgi:sialate O-acetylesterase